MDEVNDKQMAGTGLSVHRFDFLTKSMSIEFNGIVREVDKSGKIVDHCFRNDASILFFAANSYKKSFDVISNKIDALFMEPESNKVARDISHLILPYYFSFRHFVELELKAYIMCITKRKPKKSHTLNDLYNDYYNKLRSLQYKGIDLILPKQDFRDHKNKAMEISRLLREKLDSYIDLESADEYYRFILELPDKNDTDKSLKLNRSEIKLEYGDTDRLFRDMCKLFNAIRIELSCFIYTYYLI